MVDAKPPQARSESEDLPLGPMPDGLREVKVKLPAKQVLHLHYARMRGGKNFSQIVSTALTRYFDEFLKE
jgi:hypothetical protein